MIATACAIGAVLCHFYYLRCLQKQVRRNGEALIALAAEINTPDATNAAWLIAPEKKRPKS